MIAEKFNALHFSPSNYPKISTRYFTEVELKRKQFEQYCNQTSVFMYLYIINIRKFTTKLSAFDQYFRIVSAPWYGYPRYSGYPPYHTHNHPYNSYGYTPPANTPYGYQPPTYNPYRYQLPTNSPYGLQQPSYNPYRYQPTAYDPYGQKHQPTTYNQNGYQPPTYNPYGHQPSTYNPYGNPPHTYNTNGYQPPTYNPYRHQPPTYHPYGYPPPAFNFSGEYESSAYLSCYRPHDA